MFTRLAKAKTVVLIVLGSAALSTVLTGCGKNGKVTTSFETTP